MAPALLQSPRASARLAGTLSGPAYRGARKRGCSVPQIRAALRRDRIMKHVTKLLLVTAFAAGLASAASAKTLVYCSEGSPAGFDPGLYTAGTDFDASSKPVYNRLVEFERGTTNVIPGLAEKWDVSDDGLTYTFHLRQGVKFQTTDFFTPTPRLQRRRRGVLLRAHARQEQPLLRLRRRPVRLLRRHGHAGRDQERREGRRLYGEVHAERAERAVHRRPGDGFRLDHVEGIRRQAARRRPSRDAQPGAGRHRAVPRSSATRRMR